MVVVVVALGNLTPGEPLREASVDMGLWLYNEQRALSRTL